MSDPIARLIKLRAVIDDEDAARAERAAIWHLMHSAGLTHLEIAQASGLPDAVGTKGGRTVQKELERRDAPTDDVFGLGTLSGTELLVRLFGTRRRMDAAAAARLERADIWRHVAEDGAAPGVLASLAAASGVHKTLVSRTLVKMGRESASVG